ncbi:hypothetical protein AMTR_s05520p00003140, partial [Amborella trichopoda]
FFPSKRKRNGKALNARSYHGMYASGEASIRVSNVFAIRKRFDTEAASKRVRGAASIRNWDGAEGSRRPLRLGSHVMLSKERSSPSCGNIGPRAEFLYRVPSRLTRCSGSARTAVKLRFHYDLVHASREPSSRQGSFLGPCTPSTKPAVPFSPSEKRRGESKPTNLLLKRTLRPGSSGISIPLCRSSWASIADYRANPGRSCAAIRSKERGLAIRPASPFGLLP